MEDITATDGRKVEIGWHHYGCPYPEIERVPEFRTFDELITSQEVEREARLSELRAINQKLDLAYREVRMSREAYERHLDNMRRS